MLNYFLIMIPVPSSLILLPYHPKLTLAITYHPSPFSSPTLVSLLLLLLLLLLSLFILLLALSPSFIPLTQALSPLGTKHNELEVMREKTNANTRLHASARVTAVICATQRRHPTHACAHTYTNTHAISHRACVCVNEMCMIWYV